MANPFFDQPIRHAPNERPSRHWELDETLSQPTYRIEGKTLENMPEKRGKFGRGIGLHYIGISCYEERILMDITLSADENLIEAARRRAVAEQTTLNEQFQLWLENYVRGKQQAAEAIRVIRELQGSIFTNGRRFFSGRNE